MLKVKDPRTTRAEKLALLAARALWLLDDRLLAADRIAVAQAAAPRWPPSPTPTTAA